MTLLHCLVAQREPSGHYETTLQNVRVQVLRLTLPPRTTSPVYLSNHDQVWIALSDSEFTLRSSERETQNIRFRRGDTRFVHRGSTSALTQESSTDAELIVIIIMNARDHESATCDCTGNIAQSVCGCDRPAVLPSLWAVAIGNLTLAGTTLQPGQAYPEATDRDDTLLIAITPVMLRDLRGNSGASISLAVLSAGEAAWIPAGRHRFVNAADAPAQFVTLEF